MDEDEEMSQESGSAEKGPAEEGGESSMDTAWGEKTLNYHRINLETLVQ